MNTLEQTKAAIGKKLRTKVYQDVGKVMTGTFLRNLLRGLLKLIVAGLLTPQVFGVLNAVYSTFRLFAGLADFGLNYAMVTLASAAIRKKDED
ncbi:MAG: hypothetical protein AAF492_19440 [Verrucomicrobiota bacterium]